MKVKLLSHVRLLATPWTGAYQAPPSMGFSRQEYWSGLPLPSPEKPIVVLNKNLLNEYIFKKAMRKYSFKILSKPWVDYNIAT